MFNMIITLRVILPFLEGVWLQKPENTKKFYHEKSNFNKISPHCQRNPQLINLQTGQSLCSLDPWLLISSPPSSLSVTHSSYKPKTCAIIFQDNICCSKIMNIMQICCRTYVGVCQDTSQDHMQLHVRVEQLWKLED